MSALFRSAMPTPGPGPGGIVSGIARDAGAPLLLANQVEKTYPNGTVAQERVRLAIKPGEFVSLLVGGRVVAERDATPGLDIAELAA
ncbi:hypothetical protein ACU4GI_08035 [Cupriavidus basilensis]